MPVTPSLLECERRFLAALYGDKAADTEALVAGNGLEPGARLNIYRHASEQTHADALRTTYPAVDALVGAVFFEQTALGFRSARRSQSGNLQTFGAGFAAYLETQPALNGLPYLPDVARLEWLRQETALAADAEYLSAEALQRALTHVGWGARVALHPSVRLLASRHAALTIWRYATHPTGARLALPPEGERIVLWRDGGDVVMAAPDGASFACIEALAGGATLQAARDRSRSIDAGFDATACLESLAGNGLIAAVREEAPCSNV